MGVSPGLNVIRGNQKTLLHQLVKQSMLESWLGHIIWGWMDLMYTVSSALCSLSGFVHLLGFVTFTAAVDQLCAWINRPVNNLSCWLLLFSWLTCPSTQFLWFEYASFASVCVSQLMLLLCQFHCFYLPGKMLDKCGNAGLTGVQ